MNHQAGHYVDVGKWHVVAALLCLSCGCVPGSITTLLSDGLPSDSAVIGPLTGDDTTNDDGNTDVLGSTPVPACVKTGEPRTSIHQTMFEELNRYRQEQGLRTLLYSKTLEKAADLEAEDLWVRGFWSHTNPDNESPGQRAVQAGFCHIYVGENIAAGQMTVQRAMQAWKSSATHNLNLLDPDYVYVGMGFSVDTFGRRYWVQEFAYQIP